MIRTLEEPCWIAGSEDGRHYDNEDEARDAADTELLPDEAVRQLEDRCLIAECDGEGCGEQFGDEEFTVVHWTAATMANLGGVLGSFEWVTTADGKVYCDLEPEEARLALANQARAAGPS